MAEQTDLDTNPKRQTVWTRFIWFVAGAGINYLLISTPFKWLSKNTSLSPWEIAGCSMAVSTSVFFVWNYFFNFRTDSRKRDALTRYLLAVGLMWVLSSALLGWLKHQSFDWHLDIGRFRLDLEIIATQFVLSGLKFFLYHKWVFPLPKESKSA